MMSESSKPEETHNSDTLADETGGAFVEEVPSRPETPPPAKSPRKWMPAAIVIGILVIIAVIGISVGLTRRDDDDDEQPRSISGTWTRLGAPIVPHVHAIESPGAFQFWSYEIGIYDTDGTNLVVAGQSTQDNAQVAWYKFNETANEWILQATMDILDAHPESHPILRVENSVLVVADAQSETLPLDENKPAHSFQGIVRIYDLVMNEDGKGVIDLRNHAAAGDLWGTTLAMDHDAKMLAVGTPLADSPNMAHAGVVHVYDLQAMTLQPVGRPLHGPHFWAGLGGAELALSGNGKVMVATAIGTAFIWKWDEDTNDWDENPATLQDIGNQVVLNKEGSLLAATSFNSDMVHIYAYQCPNEYGCYWGLRQELEGTNVDLYDDTHMAIVNQGRVYITKNLAYDHEDTPVWIEMGNVIAGDDAVWMDQHRIIIEQDGGHLQTWQWNE